jgi:hypothetical protein
MFSSIIQTVTASVKINSQERETAASNNSHINNSNDKGDQPLHGGGGGSSSSRREQQLLNIMTKVDFTVNVSLEEGTFVFMC